MAINNQLIIDVRAKLLEELPEKYSHLIDEYDNAVARPNFRGAFLILMEVSKIKDWKPSEYLNQLIGRFWHEVAE